MRRGFGAELLTLMPDRSLGLGELLLCPALHVDLLAERGDRLPELLAGRPDVSPHFVDAGVGARVFVRCRRRRDLGSLSSSSSLVTARFLQRDARPLRPLSVIRAAPSPRLSHLWPREASPHA